MTSAIDPTASDEDLAVLARAGESRALELLLRRHQKPLHNLARYMLQSAPDAEDATQEILLKLTTGLASFRGTASFRTWAWRIATNHLLDKKRSRAERAVQGFGCFSKYLDAAVDEPLSDAYSSPEQQLLIQEAKQQCTMGMLLCLDRSQRAAFLLGEVFELGDTVAAQILEISEVNFRQRLARARRDLNQFLNGRCGLIDARNPCRCARKTQAFIRDGIVDPTTREFTVTTRTLAEKKSRSQPQDLEHSNHELARSLKDLYPLRSGPQFAARIVELIQSSNAPHVVAARLSTPDEGTPS
jgi:RNA polymerase sigma factor (sigma-70 family)